MKNKKSEPFPYVGKPLSRLILGTSNEPFRAGQDQSEVLDAALEAGMTSIDTGRVYGKAETVLGNWLYKNDAYDKVVLISKCAHPSLPFWRKRVNEKEIRKDLEESCRQLKTDTIDIYLLHRDDPDVEAGRIVEWMNALHDEGRIKAFGGSNWTHQRIEEANAYAREHGLIPFTVSSPNFSLAHQVEDPWGGGCVTLTGAENAGARKWYEQNQMPVIAYSSLACGLFSGKAKADDPAKLRSLLSKEALKGYGYPENYTRLARCEELAKRKGATVAQIALAWVLAQPMDVYPVVSSTSVKRLQENIDALAVELSEEECRFLEGN